ncbi:MAG: PPC domain-containing protein [Aureliella sp.]
MPSRHIFRSLPRAATIALLALNLGSSAHADGPALRRLFPAGAQRGSTVDVAALGEAPKWPVQVWSDDPGIKWEPQKDKGKFRVTVEAGVSAGVHHVRFYDADNATDAQRFVVGTVPEMTEPAQAESLDKSQLVEELPKLINGVLAKRSEVDSYAVDLKEGQTLVAAVDAQQVLGSPVDATLQIVSSRGTVLAQNLDSVGLDPRIIYTAKRAGRYYVRVFGFPETPDSTIGFAGGDNFVYRLTLAHGGWVQATRPLAVSSTAETKLELLGVGIPEAVASLNVPAVTDRKTWPVAADGLSNALQLDVLDVPLLIEQPKAANGTVQSVPVPASITGSLAEPHEADRYQFTAKKGTKLRFELHSRELGYPLDGVLKIFGDKADALSREDDTARKPDPRLVWQAPADGQYALEVSDVYGAGGPAWFYRVDVAPVTSDVRLSVKADHFQAKAGQPLEIEVTIDRQDGFTEPVRVAVEGLPESVECPVVVSEKDGATAKAVKLKLTGKASFSGPVRIIATRESEPAFRRTAGFGTDSQVTELWLTVKP